MDERQSHKDMPINRPKKVGWTDRQTDRQIGRQKIRMKMADPFFANMLFILSLKKSNTNLKR